MALLSRNSNSGLRGQSVADMGRVKGQHLSRSEGICPVMSLSCRHQPSPHSHPNEGFSSQRAELCTGQWIKRNISYRRYYLPSVLGTVARLNPVWLLALQLRAGEHSRESLLLCSNTTKKQTNPFHFLRTLSRLLGVNLTSSAQQSRAPRPLPRPAWLACAI